MWVEWIEVFFSEMLLGIVDRILVVIVFVIVGFARIISGGNFF